jgi:alkaline phosphatase D
MGAVTDTRAGAAGGGAADAARTPFASAGAAPIALRVQIATDEHFTQPLVDHAVDARPEWDFTVRHKVTGLPSATRLYYRFVAASDPSPIGRTLTAPAPDTPVPRLRLAFLSCQDWSANHWEGMSRLVAEDLDLVVFLGDYIYEGTAPSTACPPEASHFTIRVPDGRKSGNHQVAETLADYRTLYRTYRSDPRLQALHARHPFVVVWDDHEFSDNCWQAHETYTVTQPENRPRRAAASQAWFEYLPADVLPAPEGAFDRLAIHRDFQWGTLAHLVLTDERLYRTQPALDRAGAEGLRAGLLDVAGHAVVPAGAQRDAEALAAAAGEPPSMLGETQEQWWRNTLRGSRAQWKLWCNEVMLMRMQADLRAFAPPPYDSLLLVNTDQWDGYGSARERMLRGLREDGVTGVVALTGDIHAFAAGLVMEDYDAPAPRPALAEIVGAGLSSQSLFYSVDAAVRAHPVGALFAGLVSRLENGELRVTLDDSIRRYNPWIAHIDAKAIGYAVVDVTPERLQAQLVRLVDTRPGSGPPPGAVDSITDLVVPAGVPSVTVTGVRSGAG